MIKWTNNSNIKKAQELIKNKEYKEARIILSNELEKDLKNEQLILDLIYYIEKKELEDYQNLEKAIISISEKDSKKAEKYLSNIDRSADYNQKMVYSIKKSENLNKLIEKRNNFLKLIYEAESNLANYNLSEALQNYKKAIDIFRIEENSIEDNIFNDFIIKFNILEKKLYNFDIDTKWIKFTAILTIEDIENEFKDMEKRINQWNNLKKEFVNIENLMKQSNSKEINSTEYKAYQSIINKFIFFINRGIQKYSLDLIDKIFSYIKLTLNEANELLNSVEKINIQDETDKEINLFNKKFSDLVSLFETKLLKMLNISENYAFLESLILFNEDLYFLRSEKNVIKYLKYITEKNSILVKINNFYFYYKYYVANFYFKQYNYFKENTYLDKANNSLKKAENMIPQINDNKNKLSQFMQPYLSYEKNKYYKNFIDKYKEIIDSSNIFVNNINIEKENLINLYLVLNDSIKEADFTFEQAQSLQKQNKFSEAYNKYKEAKEKYNNILAQNKIDDLYKKVSNIDKILKILYEKIYDIDMETASRNIDLARSNFFKENYDEAKQYIDIADNLFKKYDQTSDLVEYFKGRIITAIKLRSGKYISQYDPLYNYIIELLNNAKISYDNKDYKKSLSYIKQILLDKPYFEIARKLETKILKETDEKSFRASYSEYKQKAIEKFKNNLFTEAIIEFEQLKEFDVKSDFKEIDNYILECKKRLNLVKTETSEAEKKEASQLISQATTYFINENYAKALELTERAIRLWENVPDGNKLLSECRKKLRKPMPELSQEDEIKFIQAQNYYGNGNFAKAYEITKELLKNPYNQKIEKVVKLNRTSEIKMNE